MSEENQCPSCKRADELATPRIPITIGGSRTSRAIGVRICNRCNLIIPNSEDVKFWNGVEAVTLVV